MNTFLQRLLGAGQLGFGALTGNPQFGMAGLNRIRGTIQGHQVPAPVPGYQTPPSVYGIPDAAPPPARLPYSTGGGSPTPAFQMPSRRTISGDEMSME